MSYIHREREVLVQKKVEDAPGPWSQDNCLAENESNQFVFDMAEPKPQEPTKKRYQVVVIPTADRDYFFNGLGMIPASQQFGFTDCTVIYLAGHFYVRYHTEEGEKKHNKDKEGAYDMIFDHFIQKPNGEPVTQILVLPGK